MADRLNEDFKRRTVRTVKCIDNATEITLECGHSVIYFGVPPAPMHYCSQCLHDWLETRKTPKN